MAIITKYGVKLVNGLVVSRIVEVSMNKIALWIDVRVDDWTAKRAIIARNDILSKLRQQLIIITCYVLCNF